jgi:sulfhydrogenase subunit delta
MTLLDCEDELLAVASEVEIANFAEASSAVINGPYDISLVEGSITTPQEEERIHRIRRSSKFLISPIGYDRFVICSAASAASAAKL